jgi:hypothetical protein
MSISIVPLSAHLTAAPKDHSWVSVDDTVPFFAQASYSINQFAIPPYKFVALTNDENGKPTYIEFKDTGPDGTVVAALSCTYSGNAITSIWQVI